MTTTTQPVTAVRELARADAAELDAWHAVWAAARTHDHPHGPGMAREWTVGSIAHPLPGVATHRRVALVDARIAGVLYVELPLVDNTATALVDAAVAPAYRRGGIGRVLWAEARTIARASGRDRLIAESGEPPAGTGPGSAFLAAAGMDRALENAMSVLELDRVDERRLAGLRAEAEQRAATGGYRLELWRGAPPTDRRAQIGALERTLSQDMPLGELDWEPESWDAERVGGAWDAVLASGGRVWHAVAVHERTGQLVGWTVLTVWPSTETWASQWATVVDPGHRGHRLGLLVKTANLAALRAEQPHVRAVETYNAVANRPMLAVNEAMGFVRRERWWEWQGPA